MLVRLSDELRPARGGGHDGEAAGGGAGAGHGGDGQAGGGGGEPGPQLLLVIDDCDMTRQYMLRNLSLWLWIVCCCGKATRLLCRKILKYPCRLIVRCLRSTLANIGLLDFAVC